MTFDNTNQFVLFKNDKKGNAQAPDLTGKIDVDGRELRLAAWVKKNDDGSFKLYSGKVDEFKTKTNPEPTMSRDEAANAGFVNFDDDIPF